jgi:hypothetical protein
MSVLSFKTHVPVSQPDTCRTTSTVRTISLGHGENLHRHWNELIVFRRKLLR